MKKPTELLRNEDAKKHRENVIMILGENDTARVLDEAYTKEFKFYEVEVKNGVRGYILHDGRQIEVIGE